MKQNLVEKLKKIKNKNLHIKEQQNLIEKNLLLHMNAHYVNSGVTNLIDVGLRKQEVNDGSQVVSQSLLAGMVNKLSFSSQRMKTILLLVVIIMGGVSATAEASVPGDALY